MREWPKNLCNTTTVQLQRLDSNETPLQGFTGSQDAKFLNTAVLWRMQELALAIGSC